MYKLKQLIYQLKQTCWILFHNHRLGRVVALRSVWSSKLFLFKDYWLWEPVGPIYTNDVCSIQKLQRKN